MNILARLQILVGTLLRRIEYFDFLLEQRGLFLFPTKLIVKQTFTNFLDIIIELLFSQQLGLLLVLILCPTLLRFYLDWKNPFKST
jgi:hypothetical protein